MVEIDPNRFTLRPVDALREAYAQVMDELDVVKEYLARLPTRKEQAFTGSGRCVPLVNGSSRSISRVDGDKA